MGITKRKGGYLVEAAGTRLTWRSGTCTWAVRRGRETWETAPGSVSVHCGRRKVVLSLADAKDIVAEPFSNGAMEGVQCRLAGFSGLPARSELTLRLSVAIEAVTGDLIVSVDAEESRLALRHLDWPGPVRFQRNADQETVMPFMQGALIPGRWSGEIRNLDCCANAQWLYMPWWGQTRGRSGYMAILETEDDAGCLFDHPAGGPTRVTPRWYGSLGRMAYPRSMRYIFSDHCSYVTFAKHYRRHVIGEGRFVSLTEKIKTQPTVGGLIGTPVVHTGIARHIHPLSQRFDKDNPEKNHECVPFRQRARELRRLAKAGVKRCYVHLDGWGVQGYDSHHPDFLPPNRAAGSWKGLKHLADTCHNLGYIFALHDQYRDYYHNAPSFDPEYAIRTADGKVPYDTEWFGGPQSVLCAAFAPAFVLRNHSALKEHGVRVDGTYLDVFALMLPDECYHPAHRMTRRACMDARAQCFGIIRDLEGIISSEEPVDYAVPHLHLVHHAPYSAVRWATIPCAPLWNLVYHDALFVPWASNDRPGDGWGIPSRDCPCAHAALNGGMPYLSITPTAGELARVKRLCKLHKKVALLEMVDHRFLNESRTRQETVFSDGTVVTADLSSGTWKTRRD